MQRAYEVLEGHIPAYPYPMPRTSSSKERRDLAEILYETWTEEPGDEFYYDKEHDLFRFPDGEFAFSRRYVNLDRLRREKILG